MPNSKKQQRKKQHKQNERGPVRADMKVTNTRHLPITTALPLTRRCLMTYSVTGTLTEAAASAGAIQQYRLNSPYDPDLTGTGTTANGYTTYSAAFGAYRVLRATVRLTATTTTTALTGFANIILAPSATTAITSAPNAWRSIPGARTAHANSLAQGGHNMCSMTMSYSLNRIFRVSARQYMDENDYAGYTGSNPLLPVLLNLLIAGVGSANVYSMVYSLDITYEVEWFKPLTLSL